jgi:hypothetical protein
MKQRLRLAASAPAAAGDSNMSKNSNSGSKSSSAARPRWLALLTSPSGPFAMLLAALLSLAIAHWLFSTPFMRGITQFWQLQDNDIGQYLAGFNAFVREPWHWPLLRLESINAPQGTLVTFLDAVPLYAVLLKLWQHGPDTPFRNPFAAWVGLCYALQGVAAWWLCREARLRAWMPLLAMTVLLALFAPLAIRIHHISLMSHWLLLFGLAAYLRGSRLGQVSVGAWTPLLLAAFYINLYLFCMLCLLFAADLARDVVRAPRRTLMVAAAPAVLLAASLPATMLPLGGGAGGGEWGFGYYSMNLLSPLAGGRTLKFPAMYAHDGQGEGFAYLGVFVIGATIYALRLRARIDPGFWRRHRPLAWVLAFMTLYAISNIVYLGKSELFHLDLPAWTSRLTSVMRSSGRFFWPVGYALTAFTVITLWRYQAPRRAAALLAALLVLHIWDLGPHQRLVRDTVALGVTERITQPVWNGFFGPSTRALQVYPPFGCSKASPTLTHLPTMLYAVKQRMTVSTGYVARVKRPCDNYAAEIATHGTQATGFVFFKDDFAQRAEAEQLMGGPAAATCIEANFAWLCKRPAPATLEK